MADANKLEHQQLREYDVFTDKGRFPGCRIPRGYQLIRVHTIFDGRHKARVVANGYLTATPKESVYSGVVSLRGLQTCLFIGDLDGIEPWATDIGNTYLEALTIEKVCIRAGPEFEDLKGHLLIIYKALYGLKTSGRAFGQLLQECLLDLSFVPSLPEVSILYEKVSNSWSLQVHSNVRRWPCYYNEGPIVSHRSIDSSTIQLQVEGIRTAQFPSRMWIFSWQRWHLIYRC